MSDYHKQRDMSRALRGWHGEVVEESPACFVVVWEDGYGTWASTFNTAEQAHAFRQQLIREGKIK